MADGSDAVVPFENTKDDENELEEGSDSVQGRLKKQGKYSTKWYHCSAKLEKDCFVYKRDDKVILKIFYLF